MKIPKGQLPVSVNARRLRADAARKRRGCGEELSAFLECVAAVEASGRSGATGRDNLCAAQAARLLACKAAFGNYSARQSLPAINHSLKLGKQERR